MTHIGNANEARIIETRELFCDFMLIGLINRAELLGNNGRLRARMKYGENTHPGPVRMRDAGIHH